MLIPLWARAVETERKDAIVRDDKAAEMVRRIDYDFSKFKKARLSQLGVSIRTMLLDEAAGDFLVRHQDAVVVNLGAGLDTRYERLGLDIEWYELDLPRSIELRRRFFAETERYRFIAQSMLDDSWMDGIGGTGRPVLLIAEGLFMYFEESELRLLMGRLAERFAGAEMLVEVMGPALVGKSKKHDSVSKIDKAPEFKWGIVDSRDLEQWHPGIRFVNEWCYFDYHKRRAGLVGYIVRLPFIRRHIAPRIVHLRFEQEQTEGIAAAEAERLSRGITQTRGA
jgi:O-methyltransferase involved in polyketide biosynthesis